MEINENSLKISNAVYGNHRIDDINHERSIPDGWTQLLRDYDGDGSLDDKYKMEVK